MTEGADSGQTVASPFPSFGPIGGGCKRHYWLNLFVGQGQGGHARLHGGGEGRI